MDPKAKKYLVLASIVIGILMAIGVLGFFLSREKTVTTGTQFFVSPMDASLRIGDAKLQPNSRGMVELAPGNYTVVIEREYFESQSQDITVRQDEIHEVLVVLETAYEEGLKVLDRAGESENRESIVYRISQKRAREVENNNPIMTLLPHSSTYFRIDYGVSKKFPGDPTKIALYVSTDSVESRQEALSWIRSRGFDPDQLEIIYRFFEDL